MTYIILAAGKGVRAKSEIVKIPKVLLRGADGKSLLVNTLEKIEKYSDDEHVNIVTGFLSEKVQEEIMSFEALHNRLSITHIKNEIYERGVLTSLFSGIKKLKDNTVILNGDTIYPANLFEELNTVERSTLFVHPAKDIPDSIKVCTDGLTITKVGKKLENYDYISVGSFFVEKGHLPKLKKTISNLMDTEKIEKIIWHELINYLIENGEEVHIKELLDGNTIEVDTIEDYRFFLEQQKNHKTSR